MPVTNSEFSSDVLFYGFLAPSPVAGSNLCHIADIDVVDAPQQKMPVLMNTPMRA